MLICGTGGATGCGAATCAGAAPPPPPPPIIIIIIIIIIGSMPPLWPWVAASDLMESPIDVSIAVTSAFAPEPRAVTRAAPPETFERSVASMDMNGSAATWGDFFDMGLSFVVGGVTEHGARHVPRGLRRRSADLHAICRGGTFQIESRS